MINHIAIIMDGNRRWAKNKNMPSSYGHKAGAKTLINLCKTIRDKYKVNHLTVYAFSSENNSREEDELKQLFSLLDEYLNSDIKTLQKENINVKIFGDFSIFQTSTQEKIHEINNMKMESYSYTLNIALNYGGRQEICHAFNKILQSGKKQVSQEEISQNLYISNLPDVDLLIRTGGTQRLSNFIIWHAIYAELYFTQILWPNFNEKELQKAIEFYNCQQRNFGK